MLGWAGGGSSCVAAPQRDLGWSVGFCRRLIRGGPQLQLRLLACGTHALTPCPSQAPPHIQAADYFSICDCPTCLWHRHPSFFPMTPPLTPPHHPT